MALKLKIKKTLLKRKVEGVTKEGYYGRVITFERSRQTGSGVSLRAKTNTNYTN